MDIIDLVRVEANQFHEPEFYLVDGVPLLCTTCGLGVCVICGRPAGYGAYRELTHADPQPTPPPLSDVALMRALDSVRDPDYVRGSR